MAWDIAAGILVVLACVAGVLLTAVRLPGTWLILLAALLYGWYDGWLRVTGSVLALLAAIAVIGEGVEFASSAIVAKRAGASRKAAIGALIGGFAGMFAFTIPLPIVGTMIGAALGCFLGAAIGEYAELRSLHRGAHVGFWSVVGFGAGIAAKLAAAFLMATILTTRIACTPSGHMAPANPPANVDSGSS